MINILLTALLFQTLFDYVFKRRRTSLNCGLFGGSFTKPIDELIQEKLKVLGLFNMERGKDSCGYYNGQHIVKGVDKLKEFYDLVVQDGLKANDNGNNVFIGHTRMATYGSHTKENAHPFNIDDQLVLAHNGTISNIWAISSLHDVPTDKIFVDSLALGHLLVKKGYKILEEYKGAAALLMHRTKEPGTLYVYHGATYNHNTDVWTEERPLFWLDAEEGVYLSSIKKALDFIRNPARDGEVSEVPHNEIWRIKKGVKGKKKVVDIDRSIGDTEKYVATTYTPPINSQRYGNYRDYGTSSKQSNIFHMTAKPPSTSGGLKYVNTPVDETRGLLVSDESDPDVASGSTHIYFSRGRFRKGYCTLADSTFILEHKTGKILEKESDGFKAKKFYFVHGVLLKNEAAWKRVAKSVEYKNDILYKAIVLTNGINFAKEISYYSKYPVTNSPMESIGVPIEERELWWYKGKPVGVAAFTPIFSERNYHFKHGRLVKIFSKGKGAIPYGTNTTPAQKIDNYKEEKTYDNEVLLIATRFDKTFDTLAALKEELGQIGLSALEGYCDDVLQTVLDESYDRATSAVLLHDLLDAAILKKVAISKLLDPAVGACLEDYINTVLFDINYNYKEEDILEEGVDYKIVNPDVEAPTETLDDRITKNNAKWIADNLKRQSALKDKAIFDNTDDSCPMPEPKKAGGLGRFFSDDDAYSLVDSYSEPVSSAEVVNNQNMIEETEEACKKVFKLNNALDLVDVITGEFEALSYSDLAQNVCNKIQNSMLELRDKLSQEFRSENKLTEARIIANTK